MKPFFSDMLCGLGLVPLWALVFFSFEKMTVGLCWWETRGKVAFYAFCLYVFLRSC